MFPGLLLAHPLPSTWARGYTALLQDGRLWRKGNNLAVQVLRWGLSLALLQESPQWAFSSVGGLPLPLLRSSQEMGRTGRPGCATRVDPRCGTRRVNTLSEPFEGNSGRHQQNGARIAYTHDLDRHFSVDVFPSNLSSLLTPSGPLHHLS